jgi:hypothetical protein
MIEDLDKRIAAMQIELGLVQTETSFNPFHSLLDFGYGAITPTIKRKSIQWSPRLASPSLTIHTPSSSHQKLPQSQNFPVLPF